MPDLLDQKWFCTYLFIRGLKCSEHPQSEPNERRLLDTLDVVIRRKVGIAAGPIPFGQNVCGFFQRRGGKRRARSSSDRTDVTRDTESRAAYGKRHIDLEWLISCQRLQKTRSPANRRVNADVPFLYFSLLSLNLALSLSRAVAVRARGLISRLFENVFFSAAGTETRREGPG